MAGHGEFLPTAALGVLRALGMPYMAKLCPGTACSKASLPLGPTGSSTAGPGCFHPPPQQSYFQLLVVEAATPTPQGEELRSPACGVGLAFCTPP